MSQLQSKPLEFVQLNHVPAVTTWILTVPATNAGSGATAISGYTVSNVAYTLNADPTKIDAVTFTLDKAAGTVKAQLVSAGTWYACTNTASFDWSCDTTSPQAGVAPANMLTVLAVQ